MFAATIALTYGGVTKTLNRTNQDNGGSEYYLNDSLLRFYLKISHTVPAKGKYGESHLVRLDVEQYDALGVLLRTNSSWTVIKTFDGIQDDPGSEDTAEALVGFLTPANIASLVDRIN